MKALAAMRGPLSFTAVEFSKCQHQTVVDLVDLVGTVSPGAPANQVVQGAQEPSFRVAAMTIGHEGLDRTTTAQPVRAGMMTAHGSAETMIGRVDHVVMTAGPVDPDGMTSALGFAAMMIVRLVRVVMMTVRGSVVMMIGRVAHVVMTIGDHVVKVAVHLVPAQLRSRRQTKSVIGVVVAG